MKCLDVVMEDVQEVGEREDEVFGCGDGGHAGGRREREKMKCLDVVKEDMQEVGVREDEVFGCGEGGHAGGRREGR